MTQGFTEQDRAKVAEYFGVFNPAPLVTIDDKQNDETEAYILIEGGGLTIGKVKRDAGPGYNYTLHVGPDSDYIDTYSHFDAAIKAAMTCYAVELFRRIADRLAMDALAEELQGVKHAQDGSGGT